MASASKLLSQTLAINLLLSGEIITMFVVFNRYEVLESENTHPGEGDIDSADKEEGALYEEPVITDQHQQPSTADKSVFGTAKDAVINIVRKVAQVVVKSGE